MRLQLASPDIYLSSILSIVKELTFLYICSSRSRGPAAAAGGRTSPRPPPLRQTEPRGTRNAPDKFWSAVGGFISGVGGPGQGRAAPKLERVEFPADSGPHGRGRPEVDPFDPTSFTPNASPRNATPHPGQK